MVGSTGSDRSVRKQRRMIMAYRYVNPSAMCPFYRMEDKKMIVCEGPEEGLGINVTNDGRDGQVKAYKRKYCYNNWQACALAKSLTEIAEKNS